MKIDIDHIIVGVNDLERGIAWLQERTGVRAVFGGVHPGHGTRNALLGLGPLRYLEILAPDPQQSSPTWFQQICGMMEPKLVTWSVHTSDLAGLAQKAAAAGFLIEGPQNGARTRPDGKILSWRMFQVRETYGGLLPFFIEWGAQSVHPSSDAVAGCRLERFHLESPTPRELARACQTLCVEVSVGLADKPLLRARLATPKGQVELTS